MAPRIVVLLGCLFELLPAFNAPLAQSAITARRSVVTMGSATSVAKKSAVVDEVVDTMEKSMLMFCVRSEGISANDMNMMRQRFHEDVTVRCVKNSLVKRAMNKVPRFQGGDSLLTRSNYWFFVPEEHLRTTYTTWSAWLKETKKEQPHVIVGGMFEGELLDEKGVEMVTNLPTKQELMGQTASLLKMIPTKLARSLNEAGAQRIAKVTKLASGQKLVQAIKAVEGKL